MRILIRIYAFYHQDFKTAGEKILFLKNKKLQFFLTPGLLEGRPHYRGSLQPTFWSFLPLCIFNSVMDPADQNQCGYIQILIHNTAINEITYEDTTLDIRIQDKYEQYKKDLKVKKEVASLVFFKREEVAIYIHISCRVGILCKPLPAAYQAASPLPLFQKYVQCDYQ